MLGCYENEAKTKVIVDASPTDLGAVLEDNLILRGDTFITTGKKRNSSV